MANAVNTLALGNARPFESASAFAPCVLFVSHIVCAYPYEERTRVSLVNGEALEVDLPFDRFMTRLVLDNPDS